LAWLLCGGLAAGIFIHRDHRWQQAKAGLADQPGGRMNAIALEDARGSERFWVAPARLASGPFAGEKVWWEGRGGLPVTGSRITATGNFTALPEPRNPGEFNRAEWLENQGLAAAFHAARFDGTVETPEAARMGAAIRKSFRERITAGLEEDSQQARVIRAVVIGEPPPDSYPLVSSFRNSGTLHVFCVSGLHVGMVAGIGWLLLGWARVPRRLAVPMLLPLIFGYAWITGHGAPAVRSSWMAALFLGAFVFRRKPDLLNALGAVLLAAMLWDGRLLFQPGVQLSYGVVAAIAIGTAWAARTFSWMTDPELYLPGRLRSRWQKAWLQLRRNVAGSLAVSLAAGIGSAPLTAVHFGLITPISVLAGVVLVPMVFVLLSVALGSAGLSLVAPRLSHPVNHLNGWLALACVRVADGFASVPGGHFKLRRPQQALLLVYDLDYGAAAACFSAPGGKAVLLDCGDRRSFNQQVAPSLRWHGIEPEAVVLSHPDGGHLGGGAQVWEAFPIRQALLPVKLSRSPAYRSWLNEAPRHGIRLLTPTAGTSLPFPDGARLHILHAPDPHAVSALADNRVMITRLDWKGWRILFSSDSGAGTESRLLDAGGDLKADVIIAGSHRSDLSLGDPFLDAVSPRAIIAANPRFPIEERRRPETLDYWRSRGIRVVDQAQSGGVTLKVDEAGALHIEGFLDGQPLRLERGG
jgi:ComEC/Rec2-related protein